MDEKLRQESGSAAETSPSRIEPADAAAEVSEGGAENTLSQPQSQASPEPPLSSGAVSGEESGKRVCGQTVAAPQTGEAPSGEQAQAAPQTGEAPSGEQTQAAPQTGEAPSGEQAQAAPQTGEAPSGEQAQAAPQTGEAPSGEQAQAAPQTGEAPSGEQAQAAPSSGEPAQNVQSQTPQGEQPAPPPRKAQTRAEIDLSFTETAKNRDEYIDYRHERHEGGGAPVHIFAARRIGLSHIRKGTPCQDACAFRPISHGFVLLDADGISACKYGEEGSRLACETAADEIKNLSEKWAANEDAFIGALMSPEFYSEMRQEWIGRIHEHCRARGGKLDDRFVFDYGTTLLIAVITRHWIAALNLGDGQILLFNESECQYLRLAEKESPAPKSLIYGTYLEDVQRGLWPRGEYRGVLLTTDGVNDLLDRIPAFEGRTSGHNYALQAEARFMEKGEPYQPFVYTGVVLGEKRTIDLSRQRGASDDCSLVLAIDESCSPRGGGAAERLRRRYGDNAAVQSLRRVGDNASYLVGADNVVRMVLQMPAATPLVLRSPRLNELEPVGARVRFWACEERWQEDGLRFSAYVLPADVSAQTLEAAFQCAAFGTVRQRHKAEDPRTGAVSYVIEPLLGEPVLRVFDALNALDEHIKRQNLRLNELAPGWIVMLEDEDNTLLVPQETLSEQPEAPGAPWRLTFDQLFPGLIGRLSCGERSMPLFAPGGDILDGDYYLFNAKSGDEKAARFFKILYNDEQKVYGLMNTGVYPWSITRADGQRHDVEPGRVAVLRDGDVIDVMKDGAKLFSCAVRLR